MSVFRAVSVLVSAKGFLCAVAPSGTPEPANKRLIVAVHGERAGCGGCWVYGCCGSLSCVQKNSLTVYALCQALHIVPLSHF